MPPALFELVDPNTMFIFMYGVCVCVHIWNYMHELGYVKCMYAHVCMYVCMYTLMSGATSVIRIEYFDRLVAISMYVCMYELRINMSLEKYDAV